MEFSREEYSMLQASVQVKLKSVERAAASESDEAVRDLRLKSAQDYRNLLLKLSNFALELEVKGASVSKKAG